MTLIDTAGRPLVRSEPVTRFAGDFPSTFTFNGQSYQLGMNTTMYGNKEEIDGSFSAMARSGFMSNAVVFSCMLVRLSLFSQVRFMFQEFRKGIPGDLFSTPALGVLNEGPSPGQTLQDLLARAIQDADLSGNAFNVERPGRIKRLRPDWVSILMGSDSDPELDPNNVDAEVIGYIYHPGGRGSGGPVQTFLPEEVSHFAPIPDPLAHYRGMSWLTPVIREIQGDLAASDFKTLYYTNGATPNLVVSFDATIKEEAFQKWVKAFEANHTGVANAYKTLYLGAGATATRIGSNFQEGDFKAVQGASETRIVSAAGLHPTIVGLSEGLAGSSLNEGNFTAAARLTADKTFRYLWGNFAGSIASIIRVPENARLWYDARQVDFLKDDEKDRAANALTTQQTIVGYVKDGFTAESAVDAVVAGDPRRLIHTGLTSVQLHDPNEKPAAPAALGAGPEPPKQLPAVAGGNATRDASEVRCSGCNKLLAEYASAPYRMTCARCKAVTSVGLGPDVRTFEVETNEPPVDRAAQFVEAVRAIVGTQPSVTVNVPPAAPANVSFADGAFRSEVHVEAQPPANVTIAEGAFHVTAPEPGPVTVNVVDLEPVTNAVRSLEDVVRAVPAPDMSAVEGGLAEIRDQLRRPVKKVPVRDKRGLITEIVESRE